MSMLVESSQPDFIAQNPKLWEQINALYEEFLRDNCDALWKNGGCYEVAGRLEKLGLRYVEGNFRAENYYGRPGAHNIDHGWGEQEVAGSSPTIIELTGQQFNPYLMKTFPQGPVILTSDHPHYFRYKRNRRYYLTNAWNRLFWNGC